MNSLRWQRPPPWNSVRTMAWTDSCSSVHPCLLLPFRCTANQRGSEQPSIERLPPKISEGVPFGSSPSRIRTNFNQRRGVVASSCRRGHPGQNSLFWVGQQSNVLVDCRPVYITCVVLENLQPSSSEHSFGQPGSKFHIRPRLGAHLSAPCSVSARWKTETEGP